MEKEDAPITILVSVLVYFRDTSLVYADHYDLAMIVTFKHAMINSKVKP